MPVFSSQVISLFQKRAASEPGGLLSGKDPTGFNPHEPLRLWIVQLGIIICTANILSLGLRKLRQPKVIAEVLGGIILGPTAFGRIPGFTEHIFPQDSRSYLSLTANIGLCLFLFLVGLEIDAGIIKRNARLSAIVALAGMVVPFGMGAGLAVAIYNQFVGEDVKFTHFMLFTGVAFSITAFPVLCRILTELKLLDTTVGIVVLSAGVGNDIIGWVLLALSVALVNAGTGLMALYILLVAVGWTLLILFPVKYAMKWLARVTGSIESGPSVVFMTVTMIVLFGSAFFTDIIGVHAIFGAFLAGLVVPREGNLAIVLTEKLEDMVSIIFLPLYFTTSGLSTDLGLLDDGLAWGYTIAIIVTAFVGKFGGCSLASRYAAHFNWRESMTIGSLMSCKGLVELIVLNVGLQAKILSPKVFSMFVLEALVLTFATTPLVEWLYPQRFRVRIAATGANFKNVSDGEKEPKEKRPLTMEGDFKTRFTVVLDKFEHLGGIMALVQLINPAPAPTPADSRPTTEKRPSIGSVKELSPNSLKMNVEALRVIELSDRVSAVMRSSAADNLLQSDPLLSAFRMFGVLNSIKVAPSLSIVKFDELGYSIAEHARNHGSNMVILPWLPPTQQSHTIPYSAILPTPETSTAVYTPGTKGHTNNPFDMLFKASIPGQSTQELSTSVIHSQFVRSVFSQATTDVALFVDQAMTATTPGASPHLFLPFYGGPDDRLALDFVVQLCDTNPRLTATVIRFTKREHEASTVPGTPANMLTISSEIPGDYPDTYYGAHTTQTRLQSETADNIAWAKYAPTRETSNEKEGDARSSRSRSSTLHPRVEFKEIGTHVPLNVALQEALKHTNTLPNDNDNIHHDYHEGTSTRMASNERNVTDRISAIASEGPGIEVVSRLNLKPRRIHPISAGPVIIVTGRSRRLAVENHRSELKELMDQYGPIGAEVRKTIGDVATAFSVAGVGSGIVVLQASMNEDMD